MAALSQPKRLFARKFRVILVRTYRAVSWCALLFLILLFTPLSHWVGIPLREPNHISKCDVIVLLSSNEVDAEWLTPDATQRTIGALQMYRRAYGTAIITSGSNLKAGRDYATLHANWLALAGVPHTSIIIENQSSRTYESGVEVAAIMRQHGWKSALAVTSELDVKRVRLVFEKLGIPVSVLGVPQIRPPHGLLYFPEGALSFYNAVYEYAGLALYKSRGWI